MGFYLNVDKTQIRMKKFLSSVLILMMLLTGVMGCGNGGAPGAETSGAAEDIDPYEHDYRQGEFGLVEDFDEELWLPEPDEENEYSVTEVLTADEGTFISEEVEFSVDSVFLGNDAQLNVTRMAAPEPVEGANVNAFSFSLLNTDYNGMYEISIPYDASIEGEVGAGYFNEDTRSWDPVVYEVDTENHRVIILTSHLSTYGSFVIEGEGTRGARIKSGLFAPYDHLYNYDFDYGAVIQEAFGDEITPRGKAYDLGKSVIDDWFMYTGVIFEFEGIAYSSEFLSDLSDAFGNVGLALSMAQLAVDYSRGDDQAMAVGAFNTAQGLAIGKWGTKALKLSMIGVTAIDYSLTQLREQVIGGREDVWYEAYRMYYRDHGRSGQEWYNRIKEIHDNVSQPDRFEYVLDLELEHYTYKFWDEPEYIQADYQVEAQDHGFTPGGGLNEALKDEIADYNKRLILRDTLNPVFRRLEMELREEQFREYQAELNSVKEKINQIVEFEVQEVVQDGEEPEYAGYYVQFAPLSEETDIRQWTGRLDDNGYTSTRFRVLGHLTAGAPDEIRLYETLEDLKEGNVAHVEDFVVDVPHTRVAIGELIEADLAGTWEGTTVITDFIYADLDIDALLEEGTEDIDTIEACEAELGEGLMYAVFKMFQEIMHKDIRTTFTFESTENEDVYTGTMLLRVGEVLEMAEGMEAEDNETPIMARISDGQITITQTDASDGDMGAVFTGAFDTEDAVSGTLSVPLADPVEHPNTGQMHHEFMSGNWRVERVEE